MRPLPEPMDGTGTRRSRSTDETRPMPRLDTYDDSPTGEISPGWYERERARVAAAGRDRPGGPIWSAQNREQAEAVRRGAVDHPAWPAPRRLPAVDPDEPNKVPTHYPRHQAPKEDLPGPSRRELARLIRQVRTLQLVLTCACIGAGIGVWGGALWNTLFD